MHNGVSIVGYTDLPSRMASQASQLYGMNLYHILNDMGGAEKFHVDLNDEAVRGALIAQHGELMWPAPKPKAASAPAPKAAPVIAKKEVKEKSPLVKALPMIVAAIVFLGLALGAPSSFLQHFTVFVLAVFLGWQVIWNVTPALHTPLMSVTNAHFRNYHYWWYAANRRRYSDERDDSQLYRDLACDDKYIGRISRHAAHAENVS